MTIFSTKSCSLLDGTHATWTIRFSQTVMKKKYKRCSVFSVFKNISADLHLFYGQFPQSQSVDKLFSSDSSISLYKKEKYKICWALRGKSSSSMAKITLIEICCFILTVATINIKLIYYIRTCSVAEGSPLPLSSTTRMIIIRPGEFSSKSIFNYLVLSFI